MTSGHRLHTTLLALSAAFAFHLGESGDSVRRRTVADDRPTTKRDAAWVDKRIDDWQPTKAERAFDEIGWAKNLSDARRLAEQHGRPIFLFTYDGADLACYRC